MVACHRRCRLYSAAANALLAVHLPQQTLLRPAWHARCSCLEKRRSNGDNDRNGRSNGGGGAGRGILAGLGLNLHLVGFSSIERLFKVMKPQRVTFFIIIKHHGKERKEKRRLRQVRSE